MTVANVHLGGLFASTLTRLLAADAAVEGVNSRTRRDPMGPDGTRRVVLAANGFRRVPTVRPNSIPATPAHPCHEEPGCASSRALRRPGPSRWWGSGGVRHEACALRRVSAARPRASSGYDGSRHLDSPLFTTKAPANRRGPSSSSGRPGDGTSDACSWSRSLARTSGSPRPRLLASAPASTPRWLVWPRVVRRGAT